MIAWKSYKLSDVANLTTGFPFDGHKYAKDGVRVVRGDNVTIGSLRWDADKDKRWNEPFSRACEYTLYDGDIVIGMDGSRVGKNRAQIYKSDLPLLLAQRVACIRHNEKSCQEFLYYQIFSERFVEYIKSVQTGTSIPHVSLKQIGDYPIQLPPIEEQIRIAKILRSLDDKIALNNRINHNLLTIAQSLFDEKIAVRDSLGDGYKKGSLMDIAEYLNGIAMQKYPALISETGLPVLKIKELGQGSCDNSSDRCSSSIPAQYVIKDGDIIFSWSGTLLVDYWCGGICGLNQHLFKVSSQNYPGWFIYFWTKYHLERFQRIAQDKAVTMGHIRRTDLEQAEVMIPASDAMRTIDAEISPLIEEYVKRRIENRKLQEVRDGILPQLMSGTIDLIC